MEENEQRIQSAEGMHHQGLNRKKRMEKSGFIKMT
jgi:hypothetical protein